MTTVSLDLRGAGALGHPDSPETKTRGAGLSVALHGAGIAALVLAPLLGATQAPDPVTAGPALLVKPIVVALPAAPVTLTRAPRGSAARAIAPVAHPAIVAPVETPSTITPGDVLDPKATGSTDAGPPGSSGGDSGRGGDCPFGTLCGTASVPDPTPAPEIPRVGGNIKEPKLLESRAPVYPPVAQAAGVSARVFLEAHVGADGRVREVRVLKGHPLFDEAALVSVRTRRYAPLLLNGVPTEFLVTINVGFVLRR